jgi:hypothetical protein
MGEGQRQRLQPFSPKAMPWISTNAGGHGGSIREYQSDQPSSKASSTFARNTSHQEERPIKSRKIKKIGLVGSLHIGLKVSWIC